MDTLSAIAALQDNYIWCFTSGADAVVIDPGEAAPVQRWLAEGGYRLHDILLTHHHPDHQAGVPALVAATGAKVWGAAADRHRLPPLDHALAEGDGIRVPGAELQVLETPGHTVGHISLFGTGRLFCGDTLFSAGCGRMFEGQPAQYHGSLMRLAALPGDTAVHCTHEYTVGNLAFASALTPDDPALSTALDAARSKRARGAITLPSTLAWEQRHNPFLRCAEPVIAAAVGRPGAGPVEVFAAMRAAKDIFRA